MNVVVNGLMTSYKKTGKGRTLVLLHGWADSGNTFNQLIKDLETKYKVLVLDLPGFGGTQAPTEAWGLMEYAEFVAAWLKKISEEPFGFICHSYGGAVAIFGLANNTLSAHKLVLISSAGIRNKRSFKRKLIKLSAKIAKVPLMLLPAAKRKEIIRRIYRSMGSDIVLLPNMEQIFRRIIKEDVQALAVNLKLPTLIIYGDNDDQTPAEDGRTFNRLIKNSHLEILDGSHFIHQQQPEKVAKLIHNFLGVKVK